MDDASRKTLRRHYVEIHRYVRRHTATRDDADDVTQAVFTDAARSLGSSSVPASPLGLLYTVARRRLVDHARAAGRERRRLTALTRQPRPSPPQNYPLEVVAAVNAALDSLPAEQKVVVVLKLLRGLSLAEIAEHEGITTGACKMRFSRALRALRAQLLKEGVSP